MKIIPVVGFVSPYQDTDVDSKSVSSVFLGIIFDSFVRVEINADFMIRSILAYDTGAREFGDMPIAFSALKITEFFETRSFNEIS